MLFPHSTLPERVSLLESLLDLLERTESQIYWEIHVVLLETIEEIVELFTARSTDVAPTVVARIDNLKDCMLGPSRKF